MRTILAAALAAFFAVPAFAQSNCGPFTVVIATLQERYGEEIVARGTSADSQGRQMVTMVYANTETGSWTVVQIYTDGTACVRAAGDNFERVALPPNA